MRRAYQRRGMPDAGYRIPDTGYQIPGTGSSLDIMKM